MPVRGTGQASGAGNTPARRPRVSGGDARAGEGLQKAADYFFLRFFFLFSFSFLRRSLMASRSSGLLTDGGA